jgi:hypothetical protein
MNYGHSKLRIGCWNCRVEFPPVSSRLGASPFALGESSVVCLQRKRCRRFKYRRFEHRLVTIKTLQRYGGFTTLGQGILVISVGSCLEGEAWERKAVQCSAVRKLGEGENDAKSYIARNVPDVVVCYRRTRRNLVSDGARSKGHERAWGRDQNESRFDCGADSRHVNRRIFLTAKM